MRTNATAHRQIQGLQSETARARAPANRDQHLVGGDLALLAVRRCDLERAVGVRNRPRADQRLDAEIGEAPHDRLRQLRIVERQDLGQRLDDRHLGAELGEGHAELHPDIARADHRERLRNLGQRQRIGRRQNVAAELERRQFHRLRAGRKDEMLGDDARLASVGADGRRLAIDDRRRSQERTHLGLLQKNADAVGEASDDRILPGDRARVIELRRANREPEGAERARLAQAMRRAGGVDQRLRGNAADVEAHSTELVGFDEDRVEPELTGADGSDIAAGTAADDENLAAKLVHVLAPKPGGCHPRESGGPGDLTGGAAPSEEMLRLNLDARVRGHDKITLSTPHSSMNSVAGASISVRRRWMNVAASWPSTTR